MQNTRTVLLAVVILVSLSTQALAGDYATLNFIGFSKDGKYLAFEEYGSQDGSGFPYSNIYFVDVVKNSFAAPQINITLQNETASEQQARSRAKLRAAASLRRFKIVNGNTGTMIISRVHNDLAVNNFLSSEPEKTETINFAEIVGSMYRQGNYDLILRPIEHKSKECEYAYQTVYKFELTLKDKTDGDTVVLQRDTKLPASRSCPIDYAMQYAYLYDSYIVVFVSTYSIGFEGPDMRYMAVTGTFK